MHHTAKPLPGGQRNLHSHTWMIGLAGLIAGLVLMVVVPSLSGVSQSLLLFGGFHIVGALVLLASAYALGRRRLFAGRTRSVAQSSANATLDFGWGPEWMNGLGVAAIAAAAGAVAIQAAAPGWWPLAFIMLLCAGSFTAGNIIMRSFRSADHIVLPMVDLVRGDNDLILDAGCGAGRTTIALARRLRNCRVIAVDRFDADYIENGGRGLIDHNLRVAGLSEQVRVETADLASLPFDAASFDGAVSTNVFDHLGKSKEPALREVYRVLKPGGRFLMAVWVPGWSMFAVGNAFSFFLASKADWRAMAGRAGFAVIDEGVFNHAWFVFLEKPKTLAS
jgi:SAM-dependent methyltransferase